MKNTKPKLIIIYAFAGIGKSTLAKKLNDDIPLSLCVEGDELLTMIGQWLPNEEQAREYVFAMTKSLISTYLDTGHDVIVPYLLTNKSHVKAFETIANEHNANFLEIYIKSNKEKSVKYLLERGTWGEEGAPKIGESDIPHIREIYDEMEMAMNDRKNCFEINYLRGSIEETYQSIKQIIDKGIKQN